jgi:hypothetical protein
MLQAAPDVTFFRHRGNIGDELIHAGTRQLLSTISYKEVGTWNMQKACGHTALITGSGGWCQPFHHQLPAALTEIEERFCEVIILPSSFDLAEPTVRNTLEKTRALVFALEWDSYRQIQDTCRADIGHDCAFFFNFQPYRQCGHSQGSLIAFRTDNESGRAELPLGNNDISSTAFGLDHWLWLISAHGAIFTDRAHVMIAASQLGKRVFYHRTKYHKVSAIADYSLREYPLTQYEVSFDPHSVVCKDKKAISF